MAISELEMISLSVEQQQNGGLRMKGYMKKSFENKPLISIITVVYNGEKYLEETILSVINQTYENIEYIIIDGGSNDSTLDIIKKYEKKIDYWLSERDEGIYDAMNKGIKLSSGDIIGIVNSDDTLYEKTGENIVSLFLREPHLGFIYGKLDLVDEKGNIIGSKASLGIDSFKYRLFKHMPFLHPTVFVKKGIYNSIGLFDTRYKICADYDFALRLLENKIVFQELCCMSTGRFRLGGASSSIKTYFEGHLLLKGRVFVIWRYINITILILKYFLRKVNKDNIQC